MQHTLVVYTRDGRFGNRLQLASYVLAAGIEYGLNVLLYGLLDYEHLFNASLFKNTLKDRLRLRYYNFVSGRKWCRRAMGVQVLHSCPHHPLMLSSELVRASYTRFNTSLVTGHYTYCDPLLLNRHGDQIRQILSLQLSEWEAMYLDEIFSEDSAYVGIHIRRGDYRTYKNGVFLISLSLFEDFARQIQAEMQPTQATFVICSDEEIPNSFLPELNWRRGPATLAGDLEALSRCDYVIGPPSTFNRWAAFYGNALRLEVTESTRVASLSSFAAVADLTLPTETTSRDPQSYC